ncbi:putative endonuclease lcl3 [Ascosphaera aggregata]|nr:putative endonuclease lcl3 [Ascosphaera aggregata]
MVLWSSSSQSPGTADPSGEDGEKRNELDSSIDIPHKSFIHNLTKPFLPASSLSDSGRSSYLGPSNLLATCLLTTSILAGVRIYRTYLRRIPDVNKIEMSWFRKRSLLGYVTRVGDGDNFRMFHTPGGVLAGWGWFRKVPKLNKDLKGGTLHVRLAGIDAPELAHFGNPSQPYGAEALSFLKSYILHRRVRAYIHRPDQYGRVVATVYVNRLPFPFNNPKSGFSLPLPLPLWIYGRDVSLQMLRRGLATVYEAKFGAEYGGERMERKYRKAESWAKWRGIGMWAKKGRPQFFETPREFKTRMSESGLHGTDKKGNAGSRGVALKGNSNHKATASHAKIAKPYPTHTKTHGGAGNNKKHGSATSAKQ